MKKTRLRSHSAHNRHRGPESWGRMTSRAELKKAHLRVLLVEDNRQHAELVEQAITSAALTFFDWERVGCLAAARASLAVHDFDVVLLDLVLPDASGFEALSQIQHEFPAISVVTLAENGDASSAVKAAAHGAQDCLYKAELNGPTIERVLRYAVQRQQMYIRLQKANQLLDQRNAELQATNELLDRKSRQMAQLCETAREFVDNVSHEFRTPLTVIKEFVCIIQDALAGPVTEKQREYLAIVNDRADDLAIMVDDMLDVSKLEAGLLHVWRKRSDVGDILRHVLPSLERKAAIRKVTLETSLEENLPVVYCDPEKVGRVIVNLAMNGIKFCRRGGAVKLWVRGSAEAPEVLIGITDDGPGIAPENQQLIFERFHQVESTARNSTKGFGLGLSIAKELVSLNLGEINVESEPGKGSTFSFSIPIWNRSELAARYLRRIEQQDEDSAFAALVVAELSPPVEPSVSDVVDEFLQQVFGGKDLVMRTLAHKWLILSKCPQDGMGQTLTRVVQVWSEANRNRPAGELPEIQFRPKGTWPVPSQKEKLIQEFQAELPSGSNELHSPSVLVVDDDREMLCGLGLRLTAAGFAVVTATDGRSAIESAIKHHPDAILMDNYMPVMDGLEALNQLGKNPSTTDIPVVMISASLRDRSKALVEGARFFLHKPFDANTMVTALHKVIGLPHFTRSTSGDAKDGSYCRR
jgi:signal transduction histidine kinase